MNDAHDEGRRPRPVRTLYRPERSGDTRLYVGDLWVEVDGTVEVARGELIFRVEGGGRLEAWVERDDPRLDGTYLSPSHAKLVGLPPGASLSPPTDAPPLHTSKDQVHVERPVEAGDLRYSRRLLVHVGGELQRWLPVVEVEDGTKQTRLHFELLGWPAVLAAVGEFDPAWFSHVVEIDLRGEVAEVADVNDFSGCLFSLLSFVAGQEVGITVIAGVDDDGEPVWVQWASARQAIGQPGVRWCSMLLASEALPVLAQGLTRIWNDPARREAIRRAIGYLHVAERGLLDVRVPTACIGLELMAWAVLQRESWTTPGALKDMDASVMLRLLLRACDIPLDVPATFAALTKRMRATDKNWAGPEVLINVRNRLVHPPKKIDEVEWPSGQEQLEAWQLGTWYLELVILRQLGYRGEYWSRLELNRWEGNVEPVPWSR